MEEPDLEHSRYVTLWQVHSPLNQKRRLGLLNRRTKNASWQLASGQQLLKGPVRRLGTATVEVQQALQSILRFVQTDAFAQGEVCTRKTSFKHVNRGKPRAVWSSKEPCLQVFGLQLLLRLATPFHVKPSSAVKMQIQQELEGQACMGVCSALPHMPVPSAQEGTPS
jgi:hypothetical protein